MPKAWKYRRPLPPTPGTFIVQPIGEATPEEVERYRDGRDAGERQPTDSSVSGSPSES